MSDKYIVFNNAMGISLVEANSFDNADEKNPDSLWIMPIKDAIALALEILELSRNRRVL